MTIEEGRVFDSELLARLGGIAIANAAVAGGEDPDKIHLTVRTRGERCGRPPAHARQGAG